MRRGGEVEEIKPGGAWERVVTAIHDNRNASETGAMGKTASATDEDDTPCPEDACTNGRCIEGMVSQQSWLCPCDEHGIVLQHCIASRGEVMAEQSNV